MIHFHVMTGVLNNYTFSQSAVRRRPDFRGSTVLRDHMGW